MSSLSVFSQSEETTSFQSLNLSRVSSVLLSSSLNMFCVQEPEQPASCLPAVLSVRLSPCGSSASPSSCPGLDVDPGEGVGSGGSNVGLRGVESHIVDGFLALLAVSCDLLNARFTVEVPQTQRAVVT